MNEPAASDEAPARAAQWRGMIPAARWLRRYEPQWFRSDLVAGVTLAAYVLPAALGDASLANLPPQAGLYEVITVFAAPAALVVATSPSLASLWAVLKP
jgi:MFS superfamily sulfate permease-like transporter